jgi:hypothetical protein
MQMCSRQRIRDAVDGDAFESNGVSPLMPFSGSHTGSRQPTRRLLVLLAWLLEERVRPRGGGPPRMASFTP